MINDANIVLDLVSLLMVLLMLSKGFGLPRHEAKCPSRFRSLLFSLFLILFFDLMGWLLDGLPYPNLQTPALLINTIYYAFQIIYDWFWLLFVLEWTGVCHLPIRRRLALICAVPMATELVLLLSNAFTGWAFFIDLHNTYQRGPGHLMNLIPFLIYIFLTMLLIVYAYLRAPTTEEKRHHLFLALCMFFLVVGAFIEALHYGTPLSWPLTALSLMMIYISILNNQAAEDRINAANLQLELAESRRAIMLSQIQPHFLYNALCVIQDLCHDKAPEAEKATLAFSRFLRGNMDALTNTSTISFEQELSHTKYYLELEKMRFGQRLHVVYDIQCSLFRLPPLTLQPIVENAVRNGICQLEEGGTVSISTSERADAFVICVRDNGKGFDPDMLKPNGRIGIGIKNVKERLACLTGGTLTIESHPNDGTVATFTIPKEALTK